jgi:hypothetical protein
MQSSGGETRTRNLAVNSRPLYRLSYPGTDRDALGRPSRKSSSGLGGLGYGQLPHLPPGVLARPWFGGDRDHEGAQAHQSPDRVQRDEGPQPLQHCSDGEARRSEDVCREVPPVGGTDEAKLESSEGAEDQDGTDDRDGLAQPERSLLQVVAELL